MPEFQEFQEQVPRRAEVLACKAFKISPILHHYPVCLEMCKKYSAWRKQVTPMIQQYGPLVRNLPAMMKLYSQLSKSDDTETEANEESEKQSVSEESSEKEKETETKTSDGNKKSKPKSSSLPKKSKTTDNKEQESKTSASKKRKSPLLLRKEHQAVQNRDYIFNIL